MKIRELVLFALICNPLVVFGQLIPTVGVLDHTLVPATLADPNSNAAELGLNFRPTVAGSVTSIWFYRNRTAIYDFVSLWGASGNLLARAPVTVNSGVGWNRQPLQSAVQLRVGEIYTVSYHVTRGAYPITVGFFSDDHELLLGGSPFSGYRFSATPAFPNLRYKDSNFFVDVGFVPSSSMASQ